MDAKIIYAQSSDIKARTFRQYRLDMKKKAIAELEFLPFLQGLLPDARVEKFGADADQWFLQQGGQLTQAPDYRAVWPDGREMLYEFQYAEKIEGLKHFDFKVSKVGVKRKGERAPHDDRQFFYVVKPEAKYAFVDPAWIMDKGREAPVPAWGSRPAYRVPVAAFGSQLQDGGDEMRQVIAAIDDKNALLTFQDEFLDIEAERFSHQLQTAVDGPTLIEIEPATLAGLYRVCFLLEHLRQTPENPGTWLEHLVPLLGKDMPAEDFAQWAFALDFLYFRTTSLTGEQQSQVKQALTAAQALIGARAKLDGSFARDPHASPMEETRQFLFAANLLEDLQQNFAVRYRTADKVARIYDALPDYAKTADYLRNHPPRN